MLYNVDENRDLYYNTLDFLDEQVYLTEDESFVHPHQVPIITLNGNNFIHYDYINQILEEFNMPVDATIDILSEMNNIDNLSIMIPEYELLVNPSILEENVTFSLLPISEDSIAYQFCEACIEAYAESEDENWLELLLNEGINDMFLTAIKASRDIRDARSGGNSNDQYEQDIKEKAAREIGRQLGETRAQNSAQTQRETHKKTIIANKEEGEKNLSLLQRGKRLGHRIINDYKGLGHGLKDAMNQKGIGNKLSAAGNAIGQHKAATAGAALAVGGAGLAIKKYMDYRKRIAWEAKNKPRTWLAKKIASLRSIYQKYLMRARAAKASGQASIFQKIASIILGIIDSLMKKLQNAAN